MIGSVFSNGLELVSVDSSYFVEKLNGLVSGLEKHSVIQRYFSVVSSQSLGGNLNYPIGI